MALCLRRFCGAVCISVCVYTIQRDSRCVNGPTLSGPNKPQHMSCVSEVILFVSNNLPGTVFDSITLSVYKYLASNLCAINMSWPLNHRGNSALPCGSVWVYLCRKHWCSRSQCSE